jgi:hypothetical protein
MVQLIFLGSMPQSPLPVRKAYCRTGPRRRTVRSRTRTPRPPVESPQVIRRRMLNTFARWKDPSWENLAGASEYTSRSAIGVSPEITPSVLPFFLGKRVTLATRKQRVIPPRSGGIFWYCGNLTKSSSPPAPNIDTGPPQPPPSQGGNALDSTLVYLPTAWSYSRYSGELSTRKLNKERMITRISGKTETVERRGGTSRLVVSLETHVKPEVKTKL